MSNLPEPQQAYDHLFNNVHGRVFFSRLGMHGVQPLNEKEANDLLMLAARLRTESDNENVKAASESRFGGMLGALGEPANDQQQDTLAIKQAAEYYASDADIYNSVLSLKAHEAAELAGEQTDAS